MGSKRRWILAALAAGAGVFVLGIRSMFFLPPDELPVAVSCTADAPPMPRNTPIKVMVWNVQFGAGRSVEFFYDNGQAVSVAAQEVDATLERIAEVIKEADPDIVLLQEVDRRSRRTGGVDQHDILVEKTGFSCHTSTPYHKVGYVPHPSHEHMGKVNMHLSVFSRYRLDKATRFALPLLKEPIHRRLFNLRRALFDVRVALEGGGELALFTTHLSAFSKGDGTLGEQIAMLQEHAQAATDAGTPWMLGGDLNSLPPGFDKNLLRESDRPWYAEEHSPVEPLFKAFSATISPEVYAEGGPSVHGTYGPFGRDTPDRTLDYVFYGELDAEGMQTHTQHLDISDHVPMVFEFRVP